MKKAIIIPILLLSLHVVFAQETQPGHPINAVTDQKQNINEMAWDNSRMTMMQSTDMPSSVSNSFKKEYPDQGDVTWYKSNSGYIASYNDNTSMNQIVMYDMEGNPAYMGKQIKPTSLPATTTTYLRSTFPDAEYDHLYEVKNPSGETTYQVMVNGKWMKFDKSGNMVPMK